jgi:hypothetical protein
MVSFSVMGTAKELGRTVSIEDSLAMVDVFD